MLRHRTATLVALAFASIAAGSVHAQQPGQKMDMGAGMKGMTHDSATMAQMAVVHELMMNHARINRAVTNLPNGARSVTESDDPRLAKLIQEHVATMGRRIAKGDDPGMPMESPATHAIFRGNARVQTTTEMTAKGVVVVQTSSDSALVVAIQQHAAEVSALVKDGMAAMHAAMMGRMGGGPDSGFRAMQQRGMEAMGVDQYTSTHHFEALPDGGRIELTRDVDDTAGVAQIQRHLQGLATAFAAGDFSMPGMVHATEVPGTKTMAAKRAAIAYTYQPLPRGGEVRIVTSDPEALAAIHAFLAFQREEHHAH